MNDIYPPCVIKSYKHNGRLHRMWARNWQVPKGLLLPEHAAESMYVFINHQTPIVEADGKQWISRIPAVSFFIPGEWFNVVALMEEGGVRYYCNAASPPYYQDGLLTYIDYDLDVIVPSGGGPQIVDREEYEMHRAAYHYSPETDRKVADGLQALLSRIAGGRPPFDSLAAAAYFEAWQKQSGEV
jgi:protein associated with RNAse G/E